MLALDVALLLPPDVSARAVALSAALPPDESQGLLLGPDALPHITLTQQFVETADLDRLLARVDAVLARMRPLSLTVTGGGSGGSSVWMAVERTEALHGLHIALMETLVPFERQAGGAGAFVDSDARPRDVAWVSGFRRESSFAAFTPHVTLGHASEPPMIEPFTFEATTVAACQLGRFCTCRKVLREWTLSFRS